MSVTSPDRQQKEAQLKQVLSVKLEESGEKDRIRELLRLKLIECGWRDKLKADCKELITSHQDLNKVKVADLVRELTPRARSSVPDVVKKEILNEIREFLNKNIPE
ncbi:Transcription and mRNA export factor ENY2-2-like isoform X1 [Oopsacas minuta]|uniref:Transcription and mRNA export factor ENY2 n=1 Tax=Oopsacas minuta TaxID=111878 RepID=A0AAV7KHQ2_9METZ|nr:Transcription and mRNA export factor ENY2-2-like isoform X1 [Oopsacas minuta]